MLFFLDVMLVVDMLLLFLDVFPDRCAFQDEHGLLRRWSHFGSEFVCMCENLQKA